MSSYVNTIDVYGSSKTRLGLLSINQLDYPVWLAYRSGLKKVFSKVVPASSNELETSMVNIAQTQKFQLIKSFSCFGLPGELAYCILGTLVSLHRNLCKNW